MTSCWEEALHAPTAFGLLKEVIYSIGGEGFQCFCWSSLATTRKIKSPKRIKHSTINHLIHTWLLLHNTFVTLHTGARFRN